jgi:hypothetical protein
VQQSLRGARAGFRHAHPEDGMWGVADLVEVAVEGGGDHCAGVSEIDAAAFAIIAAGPTGVDHPDLDTVAGYLIAEQCGIAAGVQGEEGRAEAGAEGRFWLGDACFRAGYFCGIAGDELVHGLSWSKPGYGRQNAIGVTGQEKDIFGGGADGGFEGVGDKGEGVGHAGVLRDSRIAEIDPVGSGVEVGILHECAGSDGVEDAGFFLLAQVNAFGVAAAFEIEDGSGGPAVFVVADQPAVGVGAERRLSGAAQSEEEGGVAFWASVGGAVHAQDTFFMGQEVIENGEDGFFHLSRIACPGDEYKFVAEGDDDGVAASGSAMVGVELQAGCGEDLPVGAKILELFFGRAEEHVMGEKVGAGGLGDNADVQAKAGVGADGAVADVDLWHAVEPGGDRGKDAMKEHFVYWLVEVIPVDVVCGLIVVDNITVFWTAAGKCAGSDDQGAGVVEDTFLAAKGVFDQLLWGQLVVEGVSEA